MQHTYSKRISVICYLSLCFIVSVPFNLANFQLLYTDDGIPSGADSAFHTYSILRILDTNDPLIRFTAFPTLITNTSAFYPSLLHLTIASILEMTSLSEISISDPGLLIQFEVSFMFAVSIAGTAGYALLLRTILEKLVIDKISTHLRLLDDQRYHVIYLAVSVLAFGIFINSLSPVVKTFNDGTYAHVFAMWLIFPYYLYFLVNKHWIVSAVLLAIIASAHNLAFLMSLSATVSYAIALLLQRIRVLKMDFLKFIAIFAVCATPALIFFYVPVVTSALEGGGGEAIYASLPDRIVVEQLKPGLYYAGIIGIGVTLLLNYRILSWLVIWAVIYFVVFDLSLTLGERFARELSVTFGLIVGISVAYVLFMSALTGRKWLTNRKVELNYSSLGPSELLGVIVISVAIFSTSYIYFQDYLQAVSNPNTATKYFTETVEESNKFFLGLTDQEGMNSSDTNRNVIALFGDNPWLKVATYGKFEVLTIHPGGWKSIGKMAIPINDNLSQILTSPDISSTACILNKYDIDYIYLSDIIPGRWYSPFKSDDYYSHLNLFQSFARSPFFDLTKEFFGFEGENPRIFAVNKENVDKGCNLSKSR